MDGPCPVRRDRPVPDLVGVLTRIFETVLDRYPIGPDDDFFELGGSSMLAISLLIAIEQETGCELPMAAIYDAPTVGGLASVLAADHPVPSLLVPLRAAASDRRLFVVHGLGGTVMELRDMARRIDADVAVIGIEAAGLGGAPPQDRVEDMAALYVERILEVQPEGPFLLAGYSFGGLVAFEMARRLVAGGRAVQFLGLLDAYPDEGFSWRGLRAGLRHLVRTPPGRRAEEARRLGGKIAFRLGIRRGATEAAGAGDASLLDVVARVRRASNAARQRYRPRPAPVDAVFFRAATRLDPFPGDPGAIWRPLVGRLVVEAVAGDHYTLVASGSGGLPSALGRHLRAVLA